MATMLLYPWVALLSLTIKEAYNAYLEELTTYIHTAYVSCCPTICTDAATVL